ncbi:MAG TPA: hypothetical protein VHP83_09260 [Aggregatilineaceae bacterium]|nr:hypothetical protein [Aggregatilineaceae bacterium]
MKKLLVVALLLVLLLPNLALAQGDQQYDQDGLSFTYPEGWFAQPGEDGFGANVSNVEFSEESDDLLASTPGVLQITVAPLVPGTSAGLLLPEENDPVFMTGFFAGFLSFVASFSSSFSEEGEAPVYTFSPLEQTTIGDRDATTISLTSETTISLVIVMNINDTAILVMAEGPVDEFDQWTDAINDIAASVNYAP